MSKTIWYDYVPQYRWKKDKLVIIMKSGDELAIDEIKESLFYRVKSKILTHPSGAIIERTLTDAFLVQVRPIIAKIALYRRGKCEHKEKIYPPSTNGWFARMEVGNQLAIFVVQKIVNSKKLWFTILDYRTGEILESHPIFPYEAEALIPVSSWDSLAESNDEKRKRVLSALLDQPPPSWEELYDLCHGVEFTDFQFSSSLRDTLYQLIPHWWSDLVREEAAAFLAILMRYGITVDSDPVMFLDAYTVTPSLRVLLGMHLKNIILNNSIFNWLQFFQRVSQHESPSMKPSPFSIHGHPTLHNTYGIGGCDVLIKYISQLNDSSDIPHGLPISKEMAKESPQLKLERLYLYYWGLNINGRLNTESIGLYRYHYIGKAHQWPHRHLAYTAAFYEPGSTRSRETLLHEIVVPAKAAEEIQSKRLGLYQLDWYVRHSRPKKYYNMTHAANVRIESILNSLNSTISPRYFKKRFKPTKPSQYSSLTEDDIKVIDTVSRALWLSDLEKAEINGISIPDFIESLQRLRDNNVLSTFYWGAHIFEMKGIIILINANLETVLSLANKIFTNSGIAALIMLRDTNLSIIQASFHHSIANELCSQLNEYAHELNIDLTAVPVVSYQRYRSNLLTRLWKDGTWDDDVSRFLSQTRMKF